MIENAGKWLLAPIAAMVCGSSAGAVDFSGSFADPTNSALVGSDLGSASFADPNAISNNVALYELIVPVTEMVTITSTSFAAGGADPYLTLFQGSGGAATFFDSNYNQAFSTGGDLDYSATLTKGHYEVALGVFANLSFAENFGSGTLADGFTGLGDPGSLGNGSYAVQVSVGASAAPEVDPASAAGALTLLAGAVLVLRGRRHRSIRESKGGGAVHIADNAAALD
jgi:hypothetical protein